MRHPLPSRSAAPATRRHRRRVAPSPRVDGDGHRRLHPPRLRIVLPSELHHFRQRDALGVNLPLEIAESLVDDVQGAAHSGN